LSRTAEKASEALENGPKPGANVQVVRRPTGNLVRDDPAEAGRRGHAAAEAKALANIGKARVHLGTAAPRVARTVVRAALGEESVSPVQASLLRDVLDRTVGKAPQELRIGMADQTMQVLDMLELED
jgi:hypothetical protein